MPAALLALFAALQVAAAPGDTTHLVIVATTDVHGRVRGWDYVRDAEAPGGLSRAATIVETLRARFPDRVVLLDAGDLLQGNPFATYFAREDARRPHPIVDVLNAMGYDAATPGNHEFNFGLDLLRRAAADATYRYVSANIRVLARTPRGVEADTLLFPPHVVLTRGGVRVGITGFTTPGVMVWDRAIVQAARVRVLPIAAAAPAALRRLGAAGADLRIVLVHAGLASGSSYDTAGTGSENSAAVLATVDPKPHLVIVGHSHREIRDTVIAGVHFVQPGNWARSLSVVHVTLVADGGRFRVVEIRPDLTSLGSVAEVPRIVRRVAPAHELVRTWADQPLGTAGPGFAGRYARVEDTPLLDFVNEVQRRRTGAQLSATAAFDVTAGFREGGVRLGDVAGVYPYENTLRAVRVSGAQLRAFLEHSARYFRTWQPGGPVINDSVPGYNFDVVHGAEYVIDASRPVGGRIGGLRVGGRVVAPDDSFTLALNSYRQEGGGGYAMLRGAPVVYDRAENVRDLLADEVRRLGALDAATFYQPSWSLAPAEAREAARRVFAPPPPPVSEADSTLLRVLAITDFHGALAPRTWGWSDGRAVGGAAALRPWLDSLAWDCGCTVVRLDAGDEMTGTPLSGFTWGRATIEAFNGLGIDAAAVGNHEFDWTVDTLRARIAEARYQFVSANLTDTAGARPPWVEPFTVISRGVKVAVIGLTTTETPTATRPENVRGLRFGDPVAAIRGVLPQARAAADLVVVLAHEGAQCDSAACGGPMIDIARQLDSGSVDLIVAGHHHRIFTTRVNGIPIVQAGSSGNTIAVADFVRVGGTRVEVRTRLVTPFADVVRPDTALVRLVAGLERRFDSITSRPVAKLSVPLRRTGPEYALGRLIADAQRAAARADVAVMNNGGIRTDLPGGTVTYGDLLQLQPFANRVVRVSLTGEQLFAVLEHLVADSTPGGHVSGIEVWYGPVLPGGTRITKTRMLDGRPVDRRRRYTLAVNDFLATGGSGFAMLRELPREDSGLTDVDALARYLAAVRQPVEAPAGRRLHRPGE